MRSPLLINIGCGAVYHRAWLNLDSNPAHTEVTRWDVRAGLPVEPGQADACYASHVLEHLTRESAERLVIECHRALRVGGVLRLVVPDLEAIARHYLRLVDEAEAGSTEAQIDYDWILLELFDQMVRTRSGGEMHQWLMDPSLRKRKFIIERCGVDVHSSQAASKLVRPGWSHYWLRIREELTAGFAALMLGRSGRAAVREGLLRASGQMHLWMYDRFSLRRLLEQHGFVDVRRCGPAESNIPGFADYELDTIAGTMRKPDSLFMEGLKG